MIRKRCTKCKETYGLTNFSKKGWVNGKQKYRSQCKKCYREYEKTESYRLSYKKSNSKPAERRRNRAGEILRKEVKRGNIIKKPCLVCGAFSTEGHHPDYDKPLEVVWLCPQHHREVHYGSLVLLDLSSLA